jgi:hypothetical protein
VNSSAILRHEAWQSSGKEISLAPGFSQVIFDRTMAGNRLNGFRIGTGILVTWLKPGANEILKLTLSHYRLLASLYFWLLPSYFCTYAEMSHVRKAG